MAERMARVAGMRVLLVDRRNHIGGNAHDTVDDAGVRIHRYGPHIFHTNSSDVFYYLSTFTAWRPYQHRVLASVDGQLVPLPINLDTVNLLYGMNLDAAGMVGFLDGVAEAREPVRTSEDLVISRVGRDLYDKFFRNYTRKQWGIDASDLDSSVAARVPARANRDSRYFTDRYQAMPLHGYTRLFERMLDHPNIKIMLNTDWREIDGVIPYGEIVYTGAVDEFFGFRHGPLPYRSIDFRFETHDLERYQEAAVVNYPNDNDYTRITEFKYLTGQVHPKTTVVYEYPTANGDPYYPIPQPQNAARYRLYREDAERERGVHFVGRLATYRYYNMDQVVAQALATFRRLQRPGDDVEPSVAASMTGPGEDRAPADARSLIGIVMGTAGGDQA
ncbi:MAG: UDP-galactopyranose mutase [Candidatus Dormibacteraeota bacterium]|uniref:UDP-galactopyranose mutase n=1 Tax=Candidatus Amunia macphersoniae TaxID=3127014 RepID=A0A934KL43_9BACT|nr:UDP-galactopyranose mutase [Candidatus Dormibacteraeota bacterium]